MVPYENNSAQRIFVLGDSTIENKLPIIKALWNASDTSPLLKAFLQQAIEIIQDETQRLASQEGLLFLHCIDVLEVAKVYAEIEADEPDETIASVLALVARLGALVLDTELNEGSNQSAGPIHILGFCTGLLPGAVAACAKDTVAIFDLACEVLAISFRLVIALVRRSKAIEPGPGMWATTMIQIPRQELQVQLKEFNTREHLSHEKQAYIGVTSKSWNTVFAPPSVIDKISNTCPVLSQISQVKTTAAMAVHAHHLSRPEVDWIIGSSLSLNVAILPDRFIISTSTGKPFLAATLRELLRSIIADISTNLLDIDRTIEGACLGLSKSRPVKISAMGPSPNIPALARKLATTGFQLETSAVISSDRQRRLVPNSKRSFGSQRMGQTQL